MKKRLTAMFVTAAMAISLMAVPANAAVVETDRNIKVNDDLAIDLSKEKVGTGTLTIGEYLPVEGETYNEYATREVVYHEIEYGTTLTFPEGYSWSADLSYVQMPDDPVDSPYWSPEDYQMISGGTGYLPDTSLDFEEPVSYTFDVTWTGAVVQMYIVNLNEQEDGFYKEEGEIFLKISGYPFEDITDENAYYFYPVLWAVSNEITQGATETHFEPNSGCTRAQVVTFLWRSLGEPAPETDSCVFTDVTKGAYYYDAVLWAVENGITQGATDTTFDPNAVCTRGQIVTFLYRTAKLADPEIEIYLEECPFEDVTDEAYYYDAVLWAVDYWITEGVSDTAFDPNGTCTRGQIVTFLYRSPFVWF